MRRPGNEAPFKYIEDPKPIGGSPRPRSTEKAGAQSKTKRPTSRK